MAAQKMMTSLQEDNADISNLCRQAEADEFYFCHAESHGNVRIPFQTQLLAMKYRLL